MANKKTDKCQYLSSYDGGYIREDQWVTEKLCSLIARKEGVELPDKFWNFSKWKALFRRQVQLASSLLIIYDSSAIYSSLKDKRAYNVRSFLAFSSVGFFSSIIEEHQSRIDAEKSQKEIELNPKSTTQLPNSYKKENKLSRLKEIDGKTRPI